MGRRPQPNVRRGLIRATVTVVALVILLLLAALIASSFAASTAKAPAPPPTPVKAAPLTPSTAIPQLGTPSALTPIVSTPAKTATTKGKKGAKSKPGGRPAPFHRSGTLHDSIARRLVLQSLRHRAVMSRSPSPSDRLIAFFRGSSNAYAASPLFLAQHDMSRPRRVGSGDALVRPLWSPDERHILFVSVAESAHFPGARWTLWETSTRSGNARPLVSASAMNLAPLGWSDGRPLYLVASSTDTSIYTFRRGRPAQLAILMPQALTHAGLSPSGRYIAFAAPTNCSMCTLDIFDRRDSSVRPGPTLRASDMSLAWGIGTETAILGGRDRIVTFSAGSGAVRSFAVPAGLPLRWTHPMKISLAAGHLVLRDAVTGRRYLASPLSVSG